MPYIPITSKHTRHLSSLLFQRLRGPRRLNRLLKRIARILGVRGLGVEDLRFSGLGLGFRGLGMNFKSIGMFSCLSREGVCRDHEGCQGLQLTSGVRLRESHYVCLSKVSYGSFSRRISWGHRITKTFCSPDSGLYRGSWEKYCFRLNMGRNSWNLRALCLLGKSFIVRTVTRTRKNTLQGDF